MRAFVLIVAAGIGCSILGGLFGFTIGKLSPEFLRVITFIPQLGTNVQDPPSLGAAFGMVCGLMLGAAAMAFSLVLQTLREWIARGRA